LQKAWSNQEVGTSTYHQYQKQQPDRDPPQTDRPAARNWNFQIKTIGQEKAEQQAASPAQPSTALREIHACKVRLFASAAAEQDFTNQVFRYLEDLKRRPSVARHSHAMMP
jgi:hypothetical protein